MTSLNQRLNRFTEFTETTNNSDNNDILAATVGTYIRSFSAAHTY